MAIERYGSKTDVVVKLVLVFFVCLLSFSVGTFVGKKFSDNQHRLAQFEPTSAEREVASTEGKTEVQGQEGLSDEDIAKLAEEFVTDDEDAAAPKVAVANASAAPVEAAVVPAVKAVAAANPHAAPAVEQTAAPARAIAEAKPEPAKPLQVAAKLAQGETPKVAAAHAPAAVPAKEVAKAPVVKTVEAPKAIPTSLPQDVAASAIGKYTVQVASYPSEPEALRMTDTLKAQGFGAFYIKADIVDKKSNQAKTWYRVSVGLFQTQKEADAYKTDLLTRAKVSSAIVQKVMR